MFLHYASIGSGDDVFALSKQAFSMLVADCELADEAKVGQRLADINVLFEGINAKQAKGELFNHRKTLNREEVYGRPPIALVDATQSGVPRHSHQSHRRMPHRPGCHATTTKAARLLACPLMLPASPRGVQFLGFLVQMVLTRHVGDGGLAVDDAVARFAADVHALLPPAVWHDANSFRSDNVPHRAHPRTVGLRLLSRARTGRRIASSSNP